MKTHTPKRRTVKNPQSKKSGSKVSKGGPSNKSKDMVQDKTPKKSKEEIIEIISDLMVEDARYLVISYSHCPY